MLFKKIGKAGQKIANNHASALKRELEGFKLSAEKISKKINSVSDIWSDVNYASLQARICELAKMSKIFIESGERTCSSIDKFFAFAAEKV